MKLSSHINLLLILLCATYFGCQQSVSPSELKIPTTVRGHTLLLSEIPVGDRMGIIDCPIVVENPTDSEQVVTLVKTGCSCYGVLFNGEKIGRGESLKIGPQETIRLNVDASAPVNESLHSFRAEFLTSTQSKEPTSKSVRCELQVYQDLKVLPKTLTFETEPGQNSVLEQPITIERIFRSKTGESSVPIIGHLPEGIEVVKIEQSTPAKLLEDQIWQAEWTALIRANVDGQNSELRQKFEVKFEANDATVRTVTQTPTVVRRQQIPLSYPSDIKFGEIPVGQEKMKFAFLSSGDGSAFILKLDRTNLPSNVRVEIPQDYSSIYKAIVYVTGTEAGEWNQTLKFTTDIEDAEEIAIHLQATIVEETAESE